MPSEYRWVQRPFGVDGDSMVAPWSRDDERMFVSDNAGVMS